MARVTIEHKCIMIARDAARKDSNARISGRSVFIKRYYGKYRLIGVTVSKKQRCCRDIFADAQKLASYELKKWNKKRHWARVAKVHKVKGAHRMAVSYFYKLLKDNGLKFDEALRFCEEKRYVDMERGIAVMGGWLDWGERKEDESPFHYKKFRRIEEYYDTAMRIAA